MHHRRLSQVLVGAAFLFVSACTGPAGPQGAPCTVKDNGNGTASITCPDGTTATLKNGTNGSNGSNGANGDAGSSCSATRSDGGINVACTDGTNVFLPDGQTGATGSTGNTGAPGLGLSTGLQISVTSVTTGASGIQVRFKALDDRGNPVDFAGKYSINTVFQPRFSLSYISMDTAAVPNVLPYTVLSKTGSATAALTTDPAPDPATVVLSPTSFTPTYPIPTGGVPATDAALKGLLVENGTGNGDYTYTFPTGGNSQVKNTANKYVTSVTAPVAYDSTKMDNTHTLWIQASRQTDLVDTTNTQTFTAVDKEYNYIPSGNGTPTKREIVTTAACSKCHNNFKPEDTVSSQFHGGGRVESTYCNVCHNPARANQAANSATFVHRLHASHKLVANPDGGVPVNAFHGIQFGFPQDVRNCDACHAGALQGGQATRNPTIAACGSCHDGVDFSASSTAPTCISGATTDSTGRFIKCKHLGGPQANDAMCATCHQPAAIQLAHISVVKPDPNALQIGVLADGGNGLPDGGAGNSNSNAAWIGAAGDVPVGAYVTTYDLKSVQVVGGKPQVTFKLKQSLDGGAAVDVDFGTYAAGSKTELIDGFVGGPSAYFVFSVPQDGIAAPADFNASASCYIKNAWNGSATSGASACTISAKDSSGYYTVEMTNVTIPGTAKMLTGGIGYTYSIATARPLTQVNLAAYPYNTSTGVGGLIIAAPDVWKVATGFTGRRAIVENARCNNCHVQLGVGPTFHAGQRNDAPTCSFCHTPNRTSSGWSANAKDFIHSIHGGRVRTVPFNWHAISPDENFSEVEFPSNLNNCQACHAPGTFDFSSTTTTLALPSMLASTVGTGKYNRDSVTNPTGWFSVSPYVTADNIYNYGAGFSYTANTGATVEAASTTLVKTPITAACSACHDAPDAVAHMESMGGLFYKPRTALTGNVEQCLICHGPGTIAPVGVVHK